MTQQRRQPQRPDPRQQSRRREEEQAQSVAQQAGVQEATSGQLDDIDPKDLMERLTDPDVFVEGGEYADLEEYLKPHISGSLVTSNWDANRVGHEIEGMALADRIILERRHGNLCQDGWLEVAQGVHKRPDKTRSPRFTADEKRHLRSALIEVRTAMKNLGINGFATKKIADTTVESRVQRIDEDDGGSSGRLGRTLDKVFG